MPRSRAAPEQPATLGGLVKHMALVEADSLVVKLEEQPYGPPWEEVDVGPDPDWEWRTEAQDAPEEVYALWWTAVQRSREVVAAVLRMGPRPTRAGSIRAANWI